MRGYVLAVAVLAAGLVCFISACWRQNYLEPEQEKQARQAAARGSARVRAR